MAEDADESDRGRVGEGAAREVRMNEARVMDALVRTTLHIAGLLTHIAAEHDLSLTQLRVLGILRDRRPRMSDLADHLGLERSTLSGLIDRAAARGLVERTRAVGDGRAFEVGLTAAGAELAARGERDIAAAVAPLTARLTPHEREQLTGLLERALGGAD